MCLIKQSLENKLITIWECQWNTMKKSNNEIKEFLTRSEVKDPINPRDAFKGGRVNATRLYHKRYTTTTSQVAILG